MPQASKRVLRVATGVGKFALSGSVQRQKFRQLMNSNGEAEDVYRVSRQLFSGDSITRITGRINADPARNGHRHDPDVVNAISRLEMRGYMTNTLLRDTDAMSMAHSLEVRVPFVDVKVVDFVLSLPGEWKINGNGSPKPLLADAVSDLLPREFMARPKMGFTLPFERWMQAALRGEISEVLEDKKRLSLVGLNDEVVRIRKKFLQSPRAVGWTRPWAIYVLVKWCEVNGIS
jgi:asparagine synthase (glutamine-hydrolysing)